jgi:hypothetical protein
MIAKRQLPLAVCGVVSLCWLVVVGCGLKSGDLYLDNNEDWLGFFLYTAIFSGGSFLTTRFLVRCRFIDHSPALRCSRAEAVGRITAKAFVWGIGFGNFPMQIAYEFTDANGRTVTGRHVGTESSFFGIAVGDEILIRYLESDSTRNAPRDALGIICAKPVTDQQPAPPGKDH